MSVEVLLGRKNKLISQGNLPEHKTNRELNSPKSSGGVREDLLAAV